MEKKVVFALLSVVFLLPLWGCDKATPVAPEGTILTLSVSPSRIGLNGTATVTVIGRKPNGSPLNPGTEVRLTTSRGTIEPTVVQVRDDGSAVATLRGDGRSGDATVRAATADATAETTIQIGETAETRPSLLISANPNTIDIGETATITIIARNADGSPVAQGQEIILTSDLGNVSPARPRTRADGTATATLSSGNQAGTATVRAILGASEAASTTVTIRDVASSITLQAVPQTVPETGGTIELTAAVFNAQNQPLAGAPVTFLAQRGTLERRGAVPTDSTGQAENTLTLTENDLRGLDSGDTFRVEVTTPGAEGQPVLRATVLIRVQ